MTGQEFKILFKQDNAYLTPDRSLTLNQAGLPDTAESFNSPAYWIIQVIKYIETEQRLHCEILSYNVGDTDFPVNQKSFADKLNAIQKVTFRHLDTGGLLNTLSSKTPVSILPVKEKPVFREEVRQEYLQQILREPIKRVITEAFLIPFKDVRFRADGVTFYKKFKGYDRTIELNIENYDIREEFDAVKNYFSNVLNTKKIQVTATVEIADNEVVSVKAKSPEIEKIDKQLIEDVKLEYLKATKRNSTADVDRSLFTMDEYFNRFGDPSFNSSTFYKDENELLDGLLKISNSKHYKHLRFLSSKHKHQVMKLRFVHKPFSFIFLIEGDKNYHIVWETLDTEEATYIWHIEKDAETLKKTLPKVEEIIGVFKVQGKTHYINSADDNFERIFHDYSEAADGFVKWKRDLEFTLA